MDDRDGLDPIEGMKSSSPLPTEGQDTLAKPQSSGHQSGKPRTTSHYGSSEEKRMVDDWLEVTDPEERRRIQNRLAQRRHREMVKQKMEAAERERSNQETAASVYNVALESDFSECDELSVPGSVYYQEEEERRKMRTITKQEKIVAAVAGAAIGLAGKEAYDRYDANKENHDVERNYLPFAGYKGADIYEKHTGKDEKHTTAVYRGRDGPVGYYSDDELDGPAKKGHKKFLESVLGVTSIGAAMKMLTGGDDKSSRRGRSRYSSRGSRRSRRGWDSMSKMQKAAMASLIAGATEAFRVSKEPGGWMGEKAKRVVTAAMGAGALGGAHTEGHNKKDIFESVIGGLIGNRMLHGSRTNIEADDRDPKGRSRSPSRRHQRSRSRSVVDKARNTLARVSIGSAVAADRDSSSDRGPRRASSRHRRHSDDDRDHRRGGGSSYYDDDYRSYQSAPRRRGGGSGRSDAGSETDLGYSEDDEKRAKKIRAEARRQSAQGNHIPKDGLHAPKLSGLQSYGAQSFGSKSFESPSQGSYSWGGPFMGPAFDDDPMYSAYYFDDGLYDFDPTQQQNQMTPSQQIGHSGDNQDSRKVEAASNDPVKTDTVGAGSHIPVLELSDHQHEPSSATCEPCTRSLDPQPRGDNSSSEKSTQRSESTHDHDTRDAEGSSTDFTSTSPIALLTWPQQRPVDSVMEIFCAWLDARLWNIRQHGSGQSDGKNNDRPESAPNETSRDSAPGRRSSGNDGRRKRTCSDDANRDADDVSDDGSPRKRRGPTGKQRDEGSKRRLACPFYKADANHCRDAQACRYPGFLTAARVKEHIYRVHKVHCHRCKAEFIDPEHLGLHFESTPDCHLRTKSTDSLTLSQWQMLKSSRNRQKWASDTEPEVQKWRDIFRRLFPRAEVVPSAYVSDDTPSNRMADYLFRELSRIGRGVIEGTIAGQQSEGSSLAQEVLSTLTREVPLLCESFYNSERARNNEGAAEAHIEAEPNASMMLHDDTVPGPSNAAGLGFEFGTDMAQGVLDMDDHTSMHIFGQLDMGKNMFCDPDFGYFNGAGLWPGAQGTGLGDRPSDND